MLGPRTASFGALPSLVLLTALAFGACGGSSDPTPAGRGADPFASDETPPLAPRTRPIARREGVQVERVTYAAHDGQRVPGLLARPARGTGPRPCVIYQGGLGTTKEQAAFIWAPLADLGAATFTIDPRHTGDRANNAKDLDRAVRDPEKLAESIRANVRDLRRAVDYLTSREDCDRRRIGYIGVSQGGLTGALLAGSDTRVRATVLMVTGGGWDTILRDSRLLVPAAARDRELRRNAVRILDPYDPARWVRRIKPRALLLVHGDRDPDTSAASARVLRAAAGEQVDTIVYRGGHDPFKAERQDEVPNRVADFLDRELIAP